MGDAYPELEREWATIERWARAEEEGFRRTLEQGERLLGELIERAKAEQTSWVSAEDAFKLHDTFGFPYEMTKELLAEEGLSVDDQGFEELMERAREVSRAAARGPRDRGRRRRLQVHVEHDDVLRFAREAGFGTRFVGYETTEAETVLRVAERANGWRAGEARGEPVLPGGRRPGLRQRPRGDALGSRPRRRRLPRWRRPGAGARAASRARSGRASACARSWSATARLATMRNHTATHLLHAALRERLGTHVRQAGSYVGPDKLRFDFTHGERLSPEELRRGRAAGERVGRRRTIPVRAIETTRDEAEALGAMALFGEKYGDWVRMVEVEDVSRELCGGTHVAATAEIGLFHVTTETSSASNVRRIEAVTGPRGGATVPGAHRAPARDRGARCGCPSTRWCTRSSASARV